MKFTEVDLFGLYIAPMSLMMAAAWVAVVVLRRVADRFGLLRHVWHPTLFVAAAYILVLSLIVRIAASWG